MHLVIVHGFLSRDTTPSGDELLVLVRLWIDRRAALGSNKVHGIVELPTQLGEKVLRITLSSSHPHSTSTLIKGTTFRNFT